jgi:broad specificity phosphatase PhoE
VIYLIRHGETEGNASRVVQFPDTPLSARGLLQAARLAERLAEARLAAILASDYARAAMTAARLAEGTGLAPAHEPLLRERHFGELRGTPYSELEARGIEPFAEDYAPPGGETWDVFHARVDRAWARVQEFARRSGGPVAVVTHGLVCHSIVRRHLGVEPQGIAFPNTAVTGIHGPPWRRADPVGCAVHLEGLEGLEGLDDPAGGEEGGAA